MHREKNLFGRVVAWDNLYRAFPGAAYAKRDRPAVREFGYHLEPRLWEIRRQWPAGSAWPRMRMPCGCRAASSSSATSTTSVGGCC
jgi:hypothetical protein